MAEKKESAYRQSLKSLDTEEGIDLAFYRPIGYMWARLAARLGITPNAITIASIFLGIGAGICFYFDSMAVNVAGMLLLIWANSFDSADGQLARMTRQYSRIGRILDGVSGDLWFAAIYIAICLRENVTSAFFMAHPWLIWVIAAVTGICHAKQAAMADYYRQFHLYFLKGETGSGLDRAGPMISGRSLLSPSIQATRCSRRPHPLPCSSCGAPLQPATPTALPSPRACARHSAGRACR